MNRVRTVLALGFVIGGSGCANLHRGVGVQPPSERAAVAEAAPPVDPFHPPAEAPSARIARYFPGLTRMAANQSATTENLRRGRPSPFLRDRNREAVPRPGHEAGLDDETTTAAVPALKRDRRPAPSPAPRREAEARLASVDREEARGGDAPLLGAGVVAEVESDAPPRRPTERPALAERPALSAEARAMTTTLTSPRRMPPVLRIDPGRSPREAEVARRDEPAEPPRSSSRNEDRQARQAHAREEDEPAAPSTPILAVAEARAPRDARDDMSPPSIVEPPRAEPAPKPVAAPEPEARHQPESPREPQPETRPDPAAPPAVLEGPPPIESPAARGPAPRARVTDPDTGGDPTLVGRPRLTRRDNLPPDVPPVSFPRTYYGDETAPAPKVADEPRSDRWTWKPRLFRRLRGEASAAPDPRAGVPKAGEGSR